MQPSRGRVITFYSYKGGTGRSMALANAAWILASAGRRVLMIDWDLEAPGLHRYFRPFLIDAELAATEGLMDMVDNYATEAIRPLQEHEKPEKDWYLRHADFSDYIVSVNFPNFPTGGKIDLLPAGRQCDQYALTVSSFNWQNFYDRLGGGGFLEAFKHKARSEYDYVLIDSRTGVSDTAGICSVQMPDTLVVCFTYNNQSIKGACAVARSAAARHEKLTDEKLALQRAGKALELQSMSDQAEPRYRIFPVPMRVDSGESERLAVRQAFARDSFADMLGHLAQASISEYWKAVEIPYTVFYAYEEVLASFKDDPQDPKSVLAAMLRLTRHVSDGDVSDYRLALAPEENRKFLDAFAETTAPTATRKALAESQRETPEQALARTAEAALAGLPETDREIARRVLTRLVRLGGEDEAGGLFAISAMLNDFNESEQKVIAALTSHRVVAIAREGRTSQSSYARVAEPYARASESYTRASEPSVSLADVRLLECWPRLIEWINQDRAFLVWRQQLRTYYLDWERNGQDRGALLSGRLLSEADLMALRRGSDLTAGEAEYIASSLSASAPPAPAAPRASMPMSPPPASAQAPVRAKPARSLAWVWVVTSVAAIAGIWLALTLQRPSGEQPTPTDPVKAEIQLPQFVGVSSRDARATATALYLTAAIKGESETPDDPQVDGVVVAQTPAAGTMVTQGSVVTLTIASLTAAVPTVVGMNLSEALQTLADRKFKLGSTDSKYVPDAREGTIISQAPAPATKVAAGTQVNVVVARSAQLSDFRLGLYFPENNAQADSVAARVRTLVLKSGAQVQRAPRPESYFTTLRPQATTNQIRYSAESERRAANDLQQLLKEAGGFPTFELVKVAQASEGFISVFVVEPPAPGKESRIEPPKEPASKY